MSKRNAIIRNDEKNRNESVPKHLCRLCNERFKKQRLLLSHRRTEHTTPR